MDDIIEILKGAIEKEKEAREKYVEAANTVNDPEAKFLLEQLAQDEMVHREILEAELASMTEAKGMPPPKSAETIQKRYDISSAHELEGVKRALKVLAEAKRELEEIQSAQEEFYSMVTHDLRSPLISVVAFAGKLLTSLQGQIPEKDHEKLYWIWSETRRLEEFVNNFLDLTHLTSGKVALDRQPLDPRAVVEAVIETLHPQAKEKGQRFDVEMGGVPWIQADEWAVKRLFMNLLGNAVRHGRSRGIIKVGAEGQDDMVRFWVNDDGPGISRKDLPHIFEKFYTDPTSRRGSGLGLAIAHQVVHAHGGRIWAESRKGEGCTFYFSLPKARGKKKS